MKIWMVDPGFLPTALLSMQHRTIHAVVAGVEAGKPKRGITRFLRYGGFLVYLHFITVSEMRSRGMRHESFIDRFWEKLPERQRRFDYPVTATAISADVRLLREKMRDPMKRGRMDDARLPLRSCGLQLLEAQRKLVAAGRLPQDALLL